MVASQSLIQHYSFKTIIVDDILKAASPYEEDFPSMSALRGELNSWKMKWLDICSSGRPKNALEALQNCPTVYPNLMKLLCTMEITTCSAVRTFSAMRRDASRTSSIQ